MPVKTGGLGHPYVPLPFNSIVCKTVLVKDTNVIKHPIYYTESSLQHRNLKLLFLAWGRVIFPKIFGQYPITKSSVSMAPKPVLRPIHLAGFI